MQQKLVIDTNPNDFKREVDELINEGWNIQPQSLTTNVSTAITAMGDSWNSERIDTRYICSVVLER